MNNPVKIELPFAGFYESLHDDAIDRALEGGFNYDHEKDEEIEAPDFWGADIDFSAIRKEYCEHYVAAFAEEFGLTLTFDEMTSPREYNFSSDRIFCTIPREEIDKIRTEVEADPLWAEEVKERFTSRSGFWSFYEPDLKDEKWARAVWDECQYEVLIQFWINAKHRNDPNNNPDWNEREYYMCDNFEIYNWYSIIKAHEAIEEYLKEEKDEEYNR